MSDKGRSGFFTTEGIGNMIGSVSAQLFQQKMIGTIPALFMGEKSVEAIRKNQELGKNLALFYMAGTSAQEVYGDFKQAGASDFAAGLGMLGSCLALGKLMTGDYFRDSWLKGT